MSECQKLIKIKGARATKKNAKGNQTFEWINSAISISYYFIHAFHLERPFFQWMNSNQIDVKHGERTEASMKQETFYNSAIDQTNCDFCAPELVSPHKFMVANSIFSLIVSLPSNNECDVQNFVINFTDKL